MTGSVISQPVILSLILFVIIAMLSSLLAQTIRLPFAAVLVVVGFIGSALLNIFGFSDHFQTNNFTGLIYYVVLPVIVFESAYRSNLKSLKANSIPILLLSIPILIVSSGLTALLLYWGMGHPMNFSLTTALVAAALLAATDPLNLITHLKNNHVTKKTMVLIEGESLFNTVLAVILFSTFTALALGYADAGATTLSQVSWHLLHFLRLLLGGIIFGIFCGLISGLLSSIIKQKMFQSLLLLTFTYGSFLLAEDYLRVSGLMTVLMVGLIMSKAHNSFISKKDNEFIRDSWSLLGFCSQSIIYLLLGITLSLSMFSEHGMAMLLAIAAVIVSRTVSIYGLLPAKLPANKMTIDTRNKNILFLGGTRGAITVALALILPIELAAWQTLQAMAFAVVLFSLFLQAPLVPILLEKYLTKQTPSQINLFKNHRRRV